MCTGILYSTLVVVARLHVLHYVCLINTNTCNLLLFLYKFIK